MLQPSSRSYICNEPQQGVAHLPQCPRLFSAACYLECKPLHPHCFNVLACNMPLHGDTSLSEASVKIGGKVTTAFFWSSFSRNLPSDMAMSCHQVQHDVPVEHGNRTHCFLFVSPPCRAHQAHHDAFLQDYTLDLCSWCLNSEKSFIVAGGSESSTCCKVRGQPKRV